MPPSKKTQRASLLSQGNREGNNDMKNTPVMGNLTYTCFLSHGDLD